MVCKSDECRALRRFARNTRHQTLKIQKGATRAPSGLAQLANMLIREKLSINQFCKNAQSPR
jgi:hypothetical protein